MVEFAYNNTKNANTGYLFFELNYSYHFYLSFNKNINLYFKSKTAKKLSNNLKKLIAIY